MWWMSLCLNKFTHVVNVIRPVYIQLLDLIGVIISIHFVPLDLLNMVSGWNTEWSSGSPPHSACRCCSARPPPSPCWWQQCSLSLSLSRHNPHKSPWGGFAPLRRTPPPSSPSLWAILPHFRHSTSVAFYSPWARAGVWLNRWGSNERQLEPADLTWWSGSGLDWELVLIQTSRLHLSLELCWSPPEHL